MFTFESKHADGYHTEPFLILCCLFVIGIYLLFAVICVDTERFS